MSIFEKKRDSDSSDVDSDKIEALKRQLEEAMMQGESSEPENEENLEKQDEVKEEIKESRRRILSKKPQPVKNELKQLKQVSESRLSRSKAFASKIVEYQKLIIAVRKEIAKIVVGQQNAVVGMLRALISDGHVLIEGVPGIAKTTLIRTMAQTINCTFSRIQFTPDLLPSDIIGISTYQEGSGFYTLKGPIFNNFILADEINRAPPKVQSALLECMAEKQATIAKESFPVPLPFFTMATQNPLENVGTYALPEAQVDRFLFKIYMGYPTIDEEQKVLRSNITVKSLDSYNIKSILDPDSILQIQQDAAKIYVDNKVEKYIVRITDATRNPKKYGIALGKYVDYGVSPRASIGIFKAARADALIHGLTYVTPHNVKTVAHDVLRHRILLSYEGQAEGIKSEQFIDELLKKVPVP